MQVRKTNPVKREDAFLRSYRFEFAATLYNVLGLLLCIYCVTYVTLYFTINLLTSTRRELSFVCFVGSIQVIEQERDPANSYAR